LTETKRKNKEHRIPNTFLPTRINKTFGVWT